MLAAIQAAPFPLPLQNFQRDRLNRRLQVHGEEEGTHPETGGGQQEQRDRLHHASAAGTVCATGHLPMSSHLEGTLLEPVLKTAHLWSQHVLWLMQGKLRIGLAEQTVLVALAQAVLLHRQADKDSGGRLAGQLEEAAQIVKYVYSQCPSYDQLIPALLNYPVSVSSSWLNVFASRGGKDDGEGATVDACSFTLVPDQRPLLFDPLPIPPVRMSAIAGLF